MSSSAQTELQGQAPVSIADGPDVGAEIPHGLQRTIREQAAGRIRRHGQRDALRLVALLFVDSLAFLAARSAFHFFRSNGPLTAVVDIFSRGYLGGPQFAIALLVSLFVLGAYRRGDAWRSPRRWLMGVTLATALALWEPLWTQDPLLVSIQFGATVVAVGFAIAIVRGTLVVIVSFARKRFEVAAKAVLVGDRKSIAEAARSPLFTRTSAYRIAQELSIDGPDAAIGAELSSVILATRADAVFVTGILEKDVFQQVVEVAHSTGCELVSISRAWELGGVFPTPGTSRGVPLTWLTQPGLKAHQLVVKRLVDIVCSGLGLIVLTPFLVVLGIAVKLTSKGPVFFSQERVGRGGRRFMILKFRSMTRDAESEQAKLTNASIYSDARLFKVPNDPRITRLGRWLRRTSLDELPQLFNVLKGDMSLVGPRPPLPEEVALYERRHMCRLEVRPGITGPWQISGRNLIRDFEKVVLLEKAYIHNWSLGLDLQILLKTIPAVLSGTGAH